MNTPSNVPATTLEKEARLAQMQFEQEQRLQKARTAQALAQTRSEESQQILQQIEHWHQLSSQIYQIKQQRAATLVELSELDAHMTELKARYRQLEAAGSNNNLSPLSSSNKADLTTTAVTTATPEALPTMWGAEVITTTTTSLPLARSSVAPSVAPLALELAGVGLVEVEVEVEESELEEIELDVEVEAETEEEWVGSFAEGESSVGAGEEEIEIFTASVADFEPPDDEASAGWEDGILPQAQSEPEGEGAVIVQGGPGFTTLAEANAPNPVTKVAPTKVISLRASQSQPQSQGHKSKGKGKGKGSVPQPLLKTPSGAHTRARSESLLAGD